MSVCKHNQDLCNIILLLNKIIFFPKVPYTQLKLTLKDRSTGLNQGGAAEEKGSAKNKKRLLTSAKRIKLRPICNLSSR